MLTGDLTVSRGDAFVVSYSVRKEVKKVHENIGYCPQFDAIIEELTGRETIWMYARLRGIKEELIDNLADRLARRLLFSQHIDKYVGAYRLVQQIPGISIFSVSYLSSSLTYN